MTRLFTPRLPNGERLEMQISEGDHFKTSKHGRTLGWKASITDELTGKKYIVMGADCSIPGCQCDAVVVAEEVDNQDLSSIVMKGAGG
jgi:hypothetical protein